MKADKTKTRENSEKPTDMVWTYHGAERNCNCNRSKTMIKEEKIDRK